MASISVQSHVPAVQLQAKSGTKVADAPKLNDSAPALASDKAEISTAKKVGLWVGGTAAGVGAGAAAGIAGLLVLDKIAGGQFGGEGTRMALIAGTLFGGISGGANGALTGSLVKSPLTSALVGAATGGAVGAFMGKNMGGKLMALSALTCAASGAIGAYTSHKIQN